MNDLNFYKIDKSLKEYTLLSVSTSITEEQSKSYKTVIGDGVNELIERQLRNEISRGTLNLTLNEIIKYGVNEFIDVRFTELTHHIIINKILFLSERNEYNNIVINNNLCMIISNNHNFLHIVYDKINNTNGMPYRIGKIHNIDVWIDPYMNWQEKRIYLFKDILLNEEFNSNIIDSGFDKKMILNAKIYIKINKSSYIDIIQKDDSEAYYKYLSVNRENSINEIVSDSNNYNQIFDEDMHPIHQIGRQ
jgi:hypothetical protein